MIPDLIKRWEDEVSSIKRNTWTELYEVGDQYRIEVLEKCISDLKSLNK